MNTKKIIRAAIIGSVYAVLTIVLAPVSYGPVQVRVSEAMTVMPAFTPAAVPGLFIGCFVANILGPYGIVDIVCGSFATLAAALVSRRLRDRPFLVPLPPVVFNGIIVGSMLHFAYGVPGLWACMGWVALGQAVACYALGMPLMKLLDRYRSVLE